MIKRRNVIITTATLFFGGILICLFNFSFLGDLQSLYYRLLRRFIKPKKISIQNVKKMAVLQQDGRNISVESALNSRCTSDYDGNQNIFHWGMFDKESRLSIEQINQVIDLAKIYRFTHHTAKIISNNNSVIFTIDAKASGITREHLMIESGMQQQAICLVCAALGVGMVFRNMGKDGKLFNEKEYATIKIKLDAMLPSYDGSYWNNSAPSGMKKWKTGNLSDPKRDGNHSLLSILANVKKERRGEKQVSDTEISQLLWAARGRTPHMYKSRQWGMTIPTWAGEQNLTSLYYFDNKETYLYENWKKNRPTHNLVALSNANVNAMSASYPFSLARNGLIILAKNENTGRALWEIGYQFQNILVQANSLKIAYNAVLLKESGREEIRKLGVTDPAAVLIV